MLLGLRKGDPDWLQEVITAIGVMETIDPLSDEAKKSLRSAHLIRTMLDAEESGTPWGSPGGPDFITLYADSPSVQAETESDPRRQIRAFRRSLAHYFGTGGGISAILARNIANSIVGARRTEIEYGFLKAFCRHFGSGAGTVDQELISRMQQLAPVHEAHLGDGEIWTAALQDAELSKLQSRVSKLKVSLLDLTHKGGTSYYFNYEFNCVDCGGFIISRPDDEDPNGEIFCKACGSRLGLFGDLTALARHMGNVELKRRGLVDQRS